MIKVGPGSATITSINESGMGVLYTAHHIFNPWPVNAGEGVPEHLGIPQHPFRATYGEQQFSGMYPTTNLGYKIYTPTVAANHINATGNPAERYEKFPPSVDFTVGVLSGRQIKANQVVDGF